MICELDKQNYDSVTLLLKGLSGNSIVVIKSVISGNTRGRIFVDKIE